MPTYDYQCDACQHTFEEFQGFNDKPLKKCPKCGKPKLRRLLGTGAAIIFKGSGFYQTDYRSESYKQAEKADQPKAAESAGTTGSPGSGTKDGAAAATPAPAKSATSSEKKSNSSGKNSKSKD